MHPGLSLSFCPSFRGWIKLNVDHTGGQKRSRPSLDQLPSSNLFLTLRALPHLWSQKNTKLIIRTFSRIQYILAWHIVRPSIFYTLSSSFLEGVQLSPFQELHLFEGMVLKKTLLVLPNFLQLFKINRNSQYPWLYVIYLFATQFDLNSC